MRSRRPIELFRYRRHLGRERHFEIVTTAAEVDDVGVVGVTQDAIKEPVAETFAVAAQQLVGTFPKRGRCNRVIALHHG